MKDAIIKWVAVVARLGYLPTACSVPQPLESESPNSMPPESISMPEIGVEKSEQPESPSDMGSYVTENMQLPRPLLTGCNPGGCAGGCTAVANIYRTMDTMTDLNDRAAQRCGTAQYLWNHWLAGISGCDG